MNATNGDRKHFVVDTNVLLHNPNALFLFADNEVIIPFDVIEELDKFKTGSDDLGRNAGRSFATWITFAGWAISRKAYR